jgi:hypothetical protein
MSSQQEQIVTTWEKAVNGPDCAGYWQAMGKEHKTLKSEMESREIVDRQDWMNVLPSPWAVSRQINMKIENQILC